MGGYSIEALLPEESVSGRFELSACAVLARAREPLERRERDREKNRERAEETERAKNQNSLYTGVHGFA